MKKTLNLSGWALLCFLVLVTAAGVGLAQQVADPQFDTSVAHPAYTSRHPKVLFDEAHLNFHTTEGRYQPFAELLRNDGYEVTANKEKFSPRTLASYDVLVIANARGAEGIAAFDTPAFTEEECDAVRHWVEAGGALLLVADHAPFGQAAENLARRFGVDMSKGYTSDPAHSDLESKNPSLLVFSRENGLLADHPITRGRNPNEQVNRVMTFTGQSLRGPEGSVAFLRLADTAVDAKAPSAADIQRAVAQAGGQPGQPVQLRLAPGESVSAAGRAQGIALTIGRGRVVILGEAAMLSAQLAGPEKKPMGMNRAGIDNRQLALNILHWLSGLLN